MSLGRHRTILESLPGGCSIQFRNHCTVDLGRNDVGKVSKSGSVVVQKLMEVECYSHVMHLSSTVTGDLLDNMTSWDALRAALPIGTVSGAPKVAHVNMLREFHLLAPE
ncbi:unnamed protein product [Calypogeia fissa]